jgi:Zn finger protein HypA/HybF involved in hydrogenase expression
MSVEETPEQTVAQHLIEGLHAQFGASLRLRGIEVEVGATVDLDHAALGAALSAGLAGIEVRIVAVAVLFRCTDCGAEFPADEHPCPVCGSVRVSLVHGEELGISRAWAESS